MRSTLKAGIGIGALITLIVIAVLGGRAPTIASALPAANPTSTSSPSPMVESSAPVEVAPEVATGVAARVRKIPDRQWRRIVSTGTWRPECPVGRLELRRIELNYRTFDGEVKRGQLVAHEDSVEDLVEIFSALFEAGFPIERMKPVERYEGEVLRSLQENNTSAFNCRKAGQINALVKDSPHANGRAVDINPVQNPWRDPRCDCWQPGREFAKVKDGPGVIRKGSLPVQLFEERGWVWQNIKVPDYMHFDTGYPSQDRNVEGERDRES